jgi:hypothetical protein
MTSSAVAVPAGRRPPLLWVAVLAAAVALGVLAAALASAGATRGEALALPALHGETSWAPGARRAPASAPRGRTALVAFLGRGCPLCLAELRWIVRRLPAGERPAVVLEPASAAPAYGVARGRQLLVLLDRQGDERTGYAFPLEPSFVVGDLRTLARER